MKTRKFFKALICIGALVLSTNVMAQTSVGDKLYQEGKTIQSRLKSNTWKSKSAAEASRKNAIAKFEAAKSVYSNTADKKKCEQEIETTKKIKAKIKTAEVKDSVATTEPTTPTAAKPAPRTDIQLTLSTNQLKFGSNPKGATEGIGVKCNYEDWEVKTNVEWLKILIPTDSKNSFSVSADKNETTDERTGIITVSCGDKIEQLVVIQKNNKLKSIANKLKKK